MVTINLVQILTVFLWVAFGYLVFSVICGLLLLWILSMLKS